MRTNFFAVGLLMLGTAPAFGQSLAIDGDWSCAQKCGCNGSTTTGTHIGQDSDRLNFTNECGMHSLGKVVANNVIRADSWNINAIVSPDQKSISWDNGSVWRR